MCEQLGDSPQLFPVLRGLILHYQERVQLQTATQLAEELLRLAESQPDPALLMLAHYMMGYVLVLRSVPAMACAHHTQALAIYSPQDHRELALR